MENQTPSWYKPELLIGNPNFDPNYDVIQQEAYRIAQQDGIKAASKDQKRIVTFDVDQEPDFLNPATGRSIETGETTRYIPSFLKGSKDFWIPKNWEMPGNKIQWVDNFDYLDEVQSLAYGRLYVPNAQAATKRTLDWDMRNTGHVTSRAATIDFHQFTSLFDMHYWRVRGNNPFGLPAGSHPVNYMQGADKPFVVLLPGDVYHRELNPDGWAKPVVTDKKFQDEAFEIVTKLGFMVLWTKHCYQYSRGATLDPLFFANYLHHHFSRGMLEATPFFFAKGLSFRVEYFGVVEPEVLLDDDPNAQQTFSVMQFFDGFRDHGIPAYDYVVVRGQAKSHCVLRSCQQFVEHILKTKRNDLLSKLVIMTDCMNDIPGFPSDDAYEKLRTQGVRLETTESFDPSRGKF